MTLSGWTRLWIVASLVIWIGGFFWLQSVNYPYSPGGEVSEKYPYRMPPIQPNFSECAALVPIEGNNRFAQFDESPECRASVLDRWNYDWQNWLSQSINAGHLPLIAFGPFILGALMLGIGWIRKGFAQQPPAKKDSSESV